jgi:hypothetical protein
VENPLGSLKLIVHRARNEMGDLGSITGKQIIVNRRGAYVWGNSFRTEIDVEAFEELCRPLRTKRTSGRSTTCCRP